MNELENQNVDNQHSENQPSEPEQQLPVDGFSEVQPQFIAGQENITSETTITEPVALPVNTEQQIGLGETFVDERDELSVETDENADDVTEPDEMAVAVQNNYAEMSREELVCTLEQLIDGQVVDKIKNDVELIKVWFYKKYHLENQYKRREFIESGGRSEDFKPADDGLEIRFKDAYKRFKDLKSAYDQQLEHQKVENLAAKYKIIEEIKELVNRQESFNDTYQEFKKLQEQWRQIGVVPQNESKNLWETYHHHIEIFYDYIKLNKEARDLDLKKNLEIKLELCEKAEQLIIEPSIKKAFKLLQDYHDCWRETGPVPIDKKEEIWERFKETTAKINKRHQDYYENLKNEQVNNLQSKTALCEKVEEMLALDIQKAKKWEEKTNEIVEIQKLWKSIGFAPRKDNNQIYKRFKDACDAFFARKRVFFEQVKGEQNNNLQLKLDLCVQAEALRESTEWKKTTDEYIQLQKRWKEIGPVPRKYSDELWKRFRAACDVFFTRKSEYFNNIDQVQLNNLTLKQQLLEKIESFTAGENEKETLNTLAEFQKQWSEIGHVPIKFKNDMQTRFRTAIKKHFDQLNVTDEKRALTSFKSRIEEMSERPQNASKIANERTKIYLKIKELEGEISVYENNIGFFSKSNNADVLINEVNLKIEKARERIATLKEKLRIIDSSEK